MARRNGVASARSKTFTPALPHCRNAASLRSNRRRFGREECFSIASQCRRALNETPGECTSAARSTAQILSSSILTTALAQRRRSTQPLRKSGCCVNPDGHRLHHLPRTNLKHDALLRQLHERLAVEVGAENVITLRTNVSVPRAAGSRSYVQRQRWFTVVDPDAELAARAQAFAIALGSVPHVRAELSGNL